MCLVAMAVIPLRISHIDSLCNRLLFALNVSIFNLFVSWNPIQGEIQCMLKRLSISSFSYRLPFSLPLSLTILDLVGFEPCIRSSDSSGVWFLIGTQGVNFYSLNSEFSKYIEKNQVSGEKLQVSIFDFRSTM